MIRYHQNHVAGFVGAHSYLFRSIKSLKQMVLIPTAIPDVVAAIAAKFRVFARVDSKTTVTTQVDGDITTPEAVSAITPKVRPVDE